MTPPHSGEGSGFSIRQVFGVSIGLELASELQLQRVFPRFGKGCITCQNRITPSTERPPKEDKPPEKHGYNQNTVPMCTCKPLPSPVGLYARLKLYSYRPFRLTLMSICDTCMWYSQHRDCEFVKIIDCFRS